jgi:hypothetical protein
MDHLPGVPQTVQESGLEGEGPMREIPLTRGKVALVDDGDYDDLSNHSWYVMTAGNLCYAGRSSPMVNGNRQLILMHSAIINTPKGMDTDHINGNGLDNRRENLRIVTRRQNLQNLHIKKTSIYPGVSFETDSNRWRAQIKINGKSRNIGRFKTEIDAAIAYSAAVSNLQH